MTSVLDATVFVAAAKRSSPTPFGPPMTSLGYIGWASVLCCGIATFAHILRCPQINALRSRRCCLGTWGEKWKSLTCERWECSRSCGAMPVCCERYEAKEQNRAETY